MKRNRIFLTVSMLAASHLVNGWAQSLTSVNSKSKNASLKDAVREKSSFPKLIEAILTHGDSSKIGSNIAPQVGLESATPSKSTEVIPEDNYAPTRSCVVALKDEADKKSAICAFLTTSHRQGSEKSIRYFRVTLAGKLEKVVKVDGKLDESGKPIRGSGSKTDEDINSPEVKKAFDAEMSYWLKDWLKKQAKAGKKT